MPPVLPHHIHFDEMGLPRSNALPILPDDRKGSSSSHQESGCSRRNSYENDKTSKNDHVLEKKHSRHSNSAKHESYREDRKPYHKSERHSKSHREDDFRDSRRYHDQDSDRRPIKDHLGLNRDSRRSLGDDHRSKIPYYEDADKDRRPHRGRDRTGDRRHHNDN